ncbi:hypothetical protein [Fontivita pretiosa]|uniref:hypothetical protein n=1 Tax=Fontivita pretiosa TaxID=2989684 RepID=UPI003D185B08
MRQVLGGAMLAGALLCRAGGLRAAEPASPRPRPADTFAFVIPFDDTLAGVANDVSFLNDKPAGANGYILARDGHFHEQKTGRRIRFFGTNMAAGEAFPDHADAEVFARRLAKAGINVVRLHHLDNGWAVDSGGSIWTPRSSDRRNLDPGQLDKLDYLIAQLRQQGIYINLNLKVSRELTPADGLPESIRQIPFPLQKRVDYFYPQLIELQKDYARRLLGHVNPYTGLSYAEDPAIAFVEINNENSLVGMWSRPLGRELDTLPEPFKGELAALWNAWLKRKYPSDEALREAWNRGLTPPGPTIVTPHTPWTPEQHGPAEIRFQAFQPPTGGDAGAAEAGATDAMLEVLRAGEADWHAMATLRGLDLLEGGNYTVSFRLRGEPGPHRVRVGVSLDQADWRSVGLDRVVVASPQWQQHTFSFTATGTVPRHVRLLFAMGTSVGKVWLSDVRLRPGAEGAGLAPDQSPAAGNVPIPQAGTPQQHADWISFLSDLERSYADQMRAVLKDELKVRANVVVTQIDYGGTTGMHREVAMEFADAHAYWQHPRFGLRDWDPVDWTIENSPQLAVLTQPGFGALGALARVRVAGKPFTVSEYDHSAPSDYVCEMLPTYATFACIQDWDAIYTFAVGPYAARQRPDHFEGFFDQNNHPGKWGFYPTAALIFRRGLVEPASRSLTLELPEPMHVAAEFVDDAWKSATGDETIDYLSQRLAVSDRPAPPGSPLRVTRGGQGSSPQARVEADAPGGKGRRYIVAAPAAAAIVGYIGGRTIQAGPLAVEVEPFQMAGGDEGFAAITAVATDNQPIERSSRVLVTVCGQVQNTDMRFNATRTSVGRDWGRGPTLLQRIPATISLKSATARAVWALDGCGRRVARVAMQRDADVIRFGLASAEPSLWYELSSSVD